MKELNLIMAVNLITPNSGRELFKKKLNEKKRMFLQNCDNGFIVFQSAFDKVMNITPTTVRRKAPIKKR